MTKARDVAHEIEEKVESVLHPSKKEEEAAAKEGDGEGVVSKVCVVGLSVSAHDGGEGTDVSVSVWITHTHTP